MKLHQDLMQFVTLPLKQKEKKKMKNMRNYPWSIWREVKEQQRPKVIIRVDQQKEPK